MFRHLLFIVLSATMMTGSLAVAQEHPATNESTRAVAITIDDLPYAGDSISEAEQTTHALLLLLAEYDVRADVFVIGNRIEIDGEVEARKNLLRLWRDSGHALHNHSYTHPHYSALKPADYLADVERGQAVVASLLAEIPATGRGRYFRAPYNDLGGTSGTRDTLIAWLNEQGIRLAPFTVEHSDYIFDDLYRDALAHGDTSLAGRIGLAYIAQLDSAFFFAERVTIATFGRVIPQVLLIHANRINADYLGSILARLRERRYRFVTLDDAMADTAYASEDKYTKRWGVSWLHRWRVGLELPSMLQEEPGIPAWIFEAYRSLHRK